MRKPRKTMMRMSVTMTRICLKTMKQKRRGKEKTPKDRTSKYGDVILVRSVRARSENLTFITHTLTHSLKPLTRIRILNSRFALEHRYHELCVTRSTQILALHSAKKQVLSAYISFLGTSKSCGGCFVR